MTRVKRTAAMMLAAMMMITAVGALDLTTAMADAAPNGKVTVSPSSFKEGDKVTLTVTVLDTTLGIGKNPVTAAKNPTGKLESGGDFSGGTFSLEWSENYTGSSTSYAKYTVKFTNVTVDKAGAKTLKFSVGADGNSGTSKYNSGIMTATVAGNTDGTPVTPPSGGDGGNARYTVHKVSSPVNSSNNVTVPSDRPRYDINDINSSSDASIRQTYFADIVVKINDSNIPTGASSLNTSHIDTDDLGSFVFDTASGSTVTMTSGSGYCEITFKAIRYTGNGKNLAFRIDNLAGYSNDIVAEVSECITRTEAGTGNSRPDDDDKPGMESEIPYVIVNKYGYGGGTVTAGETFTLSLTFYNTSGDIDASNMMITLTMPDDLMLTSSSNTFYVPTLETEKSITKSVQVTAKPAAKVQSHNIGVAMKYQYIDHRVSTRKEVTNSENIAIPVAQVDRFQITAVEIPMDIMLEEETSVTVSFVNKGRSEAFNLTASIDGNIQNPGQNQNLGNIASGATGTADFYVKPNEAGQMSGTITIVYEDNNMEEKTATIPYNATVKTMEEMMGGGGMFPGEGGMMPGEGEMPVVEDTKPKWPVIAIIAVAILIPVGVIVKKRLDKKRREQEDADL